MRTGWTFAALAGAACAAALLLPDSARTLSCVDTENEWLELELVSVEVDGVEEAGWSEQAGLYLVHLEAERWPGGPLTLSSGLQAPSSTADFYYESFE